MRRASWDRVGLARLAAEQAQVLHRRQLAALGISRDSIAHRVGGGPAGGGARWQRIGPRVVVLHSGPLTPAQQLWVAVLHSGPDAVLAGLTAAVAAGLTGFALPVLQTAVPHGAYARDLDFAALAVRVRQSRRWGPEVVHPAARPQRQRMAYAVVGAAEDADHDGRARLLLLAAVQQRLVRPSELSAVVQGSARLRRRALLVETVADAEGGAHSLPERQLRRALRRARLPEPTGQRRVLRHDGTWYLDVESERYAVAVEVNGSQHAAPHRAESDDHRRNVLSTAGRLVVTTSSYSVRHASDAAVVAVAAALLSRGWRPRPDVWSALQRRARAVGMDLRTGDWLRSDRPEGAAESERDIQVALALPSS